MGIRCWINQTLNNIVKPIPSTYIHTYRTALNIWKGGGTKGRSKERMGGRKGGRRLGREGGREERRMEGRSMYACVICHLSKRIRDPGLDLDAASGHILHTLFKVRSQLWPS